MPLRRTLTETGQPSGNPERLTGAIWGPLRGYVFRAFARGVYPHRVGFGELAISAQKIFSTFLKVLSPLVVRVYAKSVLIWGMKPS